MSSLWDYYTGYLRAVPLSRSPAVRTYDWLYDRSHGATRYALSQTPVLGWWRSLRDNMQYAEDYYQNTGEDPLYMRRYGGNTGSVSGIAGPVSGVPRMARSLGLLYPAEVMEDVAKVKTQMWHASRESADHWKSAWQEYNRRFD